MSTMIVTEMDDRAILSSPCELVRFSFRTPVRNAVAGGEFCRQRETATHPTCRQRRRHPKHHPLLRPRPSVPLTSTNLEAKVQDLRVVDVMPEKNERSAGLVDETHAACGCQ